MNDKNYIEYTKLINEYKKTLNEYNNLQIKFNYVIDVEDIDTIIYMMRSCETRLKGLRSKIKEYEQEFKASA